MHHLECKTISQDTYLYPYKQPAGRWYWSLQSYWCHLNRIWTLIFLKCSNLYTSIWKKYDRCKGSTIWVCLCVCIYGIVKCINTFRKYINMQMQCSFVSLWDWCWSVFDIFVVCCILCYFSFRYDCVSLFSTGKFDCTYGICCPFLFIVSPNTLINICNIQLTIYI